MVLIFLANDIPGKLALRFGWWKTEVRKTEPPEDTAPIHRSESMDENLANHIRKLTGRSQPLSDADQISEINQFGGDQIRISEGSQRNEIFVNFHNITGGALKCSFWLQSFGSGQRIQAI